MVFNFLLIISFVGVVVAIALNAHILVYFLMGVEEKTKLNKSFIGVFLLALSTSLPEGISAITSPLFSDPILSFNNIMGANFLTITALCLFALIYWRKKILTTFNWGNAITLLLLIGFNIAFFIIFSSRTDWLFLNISIWFWIYIIGYLIFVIFLSKKQPSSPPKLFENKFKYSKGMAIGGFIISALVMIGFASLAVIIANQMALPYAQGGMNLGYSLGGKLFLAIATAMPEILTLFWLIKKNNFAIGYAGIVGSNLLNLSFFSLTDLMIGSKSFVKMIGQKSLFVYFWPIIVSYILLYLLQLKIYQSERLKKLVVKIFTITIIGLYLVTLNS